jgi:hypothetical protein
MAAPLSYFNIFPLDFAFLKEYLRKFIKINSFLNKMKFMNQTKKPQNSTKKITDKDEAIYTLEKAMHDFTMVDNLVNEMLNNDSIDQEELKHVMKRFEETTKTLSEYAQKRNNTITELLKLIKN